MSTTPTAVPNEPAAAAPQEPQNWWEVPEPTESTEPQTPAAEGAPQAPQPQEWFLRNEDGSIVYKTADAALQGIAEKNRVIAEKEARLRQAEQLLAAQGVHFGQQPPQPQPQSLTAALAAAVERGDMTFDEAISEAIQQQTQSQLQPFMSVVEYASLNQAVEQAGQSFDPNIPAFVRSPAYAKTLATRPALKTMIQTAARNPHYVSEDTGLTFGQMLPELLAQAYWVAKATAPVAQPVQRPAPQSTTPPQSMFAPQAPQGQPAPNYPMGQFRDPFQEAMSRVPDIPLTKENLGG